MIMGQGPQQTFAALRVGSYVLYRTAINSGLQPQPGQGEQTYSELQ